MAYKFNPFTGNLDEVGAGSGGEVELNLGSEGSPSLFFNGDTNTGLYSPGADQVAISTNGTGRLFVDASGSVSIGDTWANNANPVVYITKNSDVGSIVLKGNGGTSNALAVYNGGWSGSNQVFSVRGDGSVWGRTDLVLGTGSSFTERLRIDSSGNVGIGTSAPGAGLHIATAGQTTSALDTSGSLNLLVSDTGGIAGNGGSIVFGFNNGSGRFASIKGQVITGAGNSIGHLTFSTRNATSDTALTERLRITNDGLVGIGTASPATTLDVNGSASFASDVKIGGTLPSAPNISLNADGSATFAGNLGIGETSPAAGLDVKVDTNPVLAIDRGSANTANFNLQYNGTTTGQLSAANGNFQISASGASTPISFYANGAERLRIDSSGMVGIHTTSKFDTNNVALAVKGAFPETPIEIQQTGVTTGHYCITFRNANGLVGNIQTGGSTTYYSTSSDYRLKENVVDLTAAISRLKTLPVHRFNFIADAETTVDGFLAHEAQTVVPESVCGTKDEVDADGNAVIQSIDQAKLIPLLTAALQEAIAKIETLEQRLSEAGIA